MKIITLDFETYYDKDYSLTKMSTSAYIRDPLFKVHMAGIKVDDEPTVVCVTEKTIREALAEINWSNAALLGHNVAFDGFILTQVYGHVPKYYLDTLSMARALYPLFASHSLEAVAKFFELSGKIEGRLVKSKGRRDLEAGEIIELAEYCERDVDTCKQIFDRMSMPKTEMDLIDLTMRLFCEPILEIDVERADAELKKEIVLKSNLMSTAGATAESLLSNDKFAAALEALGVEPPQKISAKTKEKTWAFAKTDQGFKDLMQHPNPAVIRLMQARLAVKSTGNITRAKRFVDEGKVGTFPVGLKYYGAHTGRWSGTNKMNLQNLQRGGELRRSLLAPAGHVVVVADSAQIEARVNAWFAGQLDLLDDFRNKIDIYSKFASAVYGQPITKADATERFVGKTCIAHGTLVQCLSGWKPIQEVTTEDRLWDGEEWVCHKGLQNNGFKQTLPLCGAWLTPDHLVWSGTRWLEAQYLERDELTRSQALGHAADSFALQDISKVPGAELPASSLHARVESSTQWLETVLKTLEARDVIPAEKLHRIRKGIGSIVSICQKQHIEDGCSTDYLQQLVDATIKEIGTIETMASVGSTYAPSGEKIAAGSLRMLEHLRGGITQLWIWIEQIIVADTSQATSDSYREKLMSPTEEPSTHLRRKLEVYDVLSCGPRNRFTILTNCGPLIVHNCILGLGFQMGAPKLQDTLRKANIHMTLEECEDLVRTYRRLYSKIAANWRVMENMIGFMAGEIKENQFVKQQKKEYVIQEVTFKRRHVVLPNGMPMLYPDLQYRESEEGVLLSARYRDPRGNHIDLYGGKLTENLVQALARIIVAEQMLTISRRYRVATMSHDEVVAIAPKSEADDALTFMLETMSTPPSWCSDLPLAAEGAYDTCYSK